MNFFDCIISRRSVRKYQEKDISPDDIRKILEAAMAAPSACNNQPWEYIVVTDKEKLAEIREYLHFANYNAPCAIFVCANMDYVKGGAGRYWEQDCSASMQNILLSATGLGLGSCWIGLHPLEHLVNAMRKCLDVPNHVNLLGIAYIGYPAEEKQPRTQYNENVIYYQKYDLNRKHKARKKNLKYIE